VVSVRLIIEVLDHYHGSRTHKLWLIALAEKADDQTRLGWCPRRVLAARVGVSEVRASNIAAELIAEGVIKRERPGNRHHSTVYALGELNGRVLPERTDEDWPW
jgi:hypothetical protein